MSPDRWKRLTELFEAALALPPESRDAYLVAECRNDTELRSQVARLLADDARSDGFLRDSTVAESSIRRGAAPAVGDRIGAYRLVRQVGAGGMGSVWLAERADEQFQGRVAVKFIQGGLESAESLRRFRQERQLLANLQHPNISRLLDGGVTPDGRPYLIMEYVDGLPIDRYCNQHGLSIPDRLELIRSVCLAVHYAHQNLIVHRDLKPANILVSETGIATLLDFGIAKLLKPGSTHGARDVTMTGQSIMTPGYASPEQVRGEPITTASDIYAVGVILYEVLTGQLPYRLSSDSLGEFARAVCEQEPTSPSAAVANNSVHRAHGDRPLPNSGMSARQLRSALAGDLDTITLMALRKEPQRRYSSAEQLAEDIRKHLKGLPVMARPDTFRYRSAKFVRRNRLAVALAAIVFIVLSIFAIVTKIQSTRLAEQSRLAQQRYQQTQQVAEFQAKMLGGVDPQIMGRTIIGELRKQVTAGLARQRVKGDDGRMRPLTADETVAVLRRFDEALAPGNPVDVARQVIDVNVLKPALDAVQVQFAGQPEVEAKLRRTIGRVYMALGLYPAAEPQLRNALALQRAAHADDRAEFAQTLAELGQVLHLTGNLDAAEPLLRQGLAMQRKLFGSENTEVAASASNLGHLLMSKGDLGGAEPLLREAMNIRRKVLGDENLDVAHSLHNLAGVMFYKKDYDAAESLCREALAIERKLCGNEDWRVANTLNSLAGVLDAKGDYAAALPLEREVLEIRSRTLGEDDLSTITARHNLASFYMQQGSWAEAEPLEREALRGWTAHLEPDDDRLVSARLSLAEILTKLGRYAEAEPLLLDAWRALPDEPKDQEDRHNTLSHLIDLYQAWGKPDRVAQYRALLAEK